MGDFSCCGAIELITNLLAITPELETMLPVQPDEQGA